MSANTQPVLTKPVRCAVYTRKSTEDGLEQDFNSLDAQREAGEAYIKSQVNLGWNCLAERYDDGGYSGGDMDRPAVKRLLVDIEAGKIDCVVVYKVARLSRSLLDFARMMETFEKNHISFVSVTQHFNTATSLGRLVLNILLSFAQFEREMISERTRDKIAATRRKGKWSGGQPLLGYDVQNTRLIVNDTEAFRVREIFGLYLKLGTLLTTVKELNQRGWRTKAWSTKKGKQLGGQPFTKTRLHHLLTNVTYVGKLRYKKEIHTGEHAAIVDESVFQNVQQSLRVNGRSGGRLTRNKHGALLKGILKCASCSCGMTPVFAKKGNRLYRYYVCNHAQQQGWANCPAPSVPAGEIEDFVVAEIRGVGGDTAVLKAAVRHYRIETEERTAKLCQENGVLRREVVQIANDIEQLVMFAPPNGGGLASTLALNERMRIAQRRLDEINDELSALGKQQIDENDAERLLGEFDSIWASLSPREQSRLIDLLVERVVHDGKNGTIAITFRPMGNMSLNSNPTHLKGDVA